MAQLPQPPIAPEDIAACDDIIWRGSKSFHAASRLLPRHVRVAAMALYAFCRLSDDMVDEGEDRDKALGDLRKRLDRLYAGAPCDDVADRTFAAVVEAYDIPRAIPDALLEGYKWDVDGRRYETIGEVISYATRVAATVGVMMTVVMGRREAHVLARASDLGVAMQLTNIARDVGEDARNGRIYLPTAWLGEEGVDVDAFLANPVYDERIGRVVKRLLLEADRLYYRGMTGLRDLPITCRSAIYAAGIIYRDIGRVIARNNFDSVSSRAVTSRSRKLVLCTCALIKPTWLFICDMRPALPETQFLVDATVEGERQGAFQKSFLGRRLLQLLSLVGALQQRDRMSYDERSARL